MLLTHVGRRSGKVRRTILAVLRFDPYTREIMAISAWSASDWYLNIQASPALQVETGFTRYTPVQRVLSPWEKYPPTDQLLPVLHYRSGHCSDQAGADHHPSSVPVKGGAAAILMATALPPNQEMAMNRILLCRLGLLNFSLAMFKIAMPYLFHWREVMGPSAA